MQLVVSGIDTMTGGPRLSVMVRGWLLEHIGSSGEAGIYTFVDTPESRKIVRCAQMRSPGLESYLPQVQVRMAGDDFFTRPAVKKALILETADSFGLASWISLVERSSRFNEEWVVKSRTMRNDRFCRLANQFLK